MQYACIYCSEHLKTSEFLKSHEAKCIFKKFFNKYNLIINDKNTITYMNALKICPTYHTVSKNELLNNIAIYCRKYYYDLNILKNYIEYSNNNNFSIFDRLQIIANITNNDIDIIYKLTILVKEDKLVNANNFTSNIYNIHKLSI